MEQKHLAPAVRKLAEVAHAFTDVDLDQPWKWRAHREGVRFALIGTYHELRDLAVRLAHERARQGPPLTLSQRALAPYHTAYRELQTLLLGLDEADYERSPGPGEWPLRTVLGHLVATERTFFTLVHYGLARQRSADDLPARLPDGEVEKVMGPHADFQELYRDGTIAQLLVFYEQLHGRAMGEFASIGDAELTGPSLWWEGEEYSLQYRLHRFDAHLRQHTIQVEKTLAALQHPHTEARRHLRLIYRALADVENLLVGAPDLGLDARQALAQTIRERAATVQTVVEQAQAVAQAVQAADAQAIEQLLQENDMLCNALNDSGLPVVLDAVYRGQENIAQMLVDAGAELDIFTASALGRQDVVKELLAEWAGRLNLFARDGFTPLQLACFFGRQELALWLIEQGAEVDAVAQNAQQIQPIHAAAANGNLAIVEALLEAGADANARQQLDFTPLHEAAQRGDKPLLELLLAHGADVLAGDARGRTPLDLAREQGHETLVARLRELEAEGVNAPS